MRFLTKRQEVLLSLINELSKKNMSSKLGVVKSLFLLREEENIADSIKFYSFLPYKFGPYSYTSYQDLEKLKSEGYLSEDEKSLTDKGLKVIENIDLSVVAKIKRVVNRFNSDKQIKDYVYKNYPIETMKSQLLEYKKKEKKLGIYTIGYEGKDIDSFLNSLIKNEIDIVIDIRNNPFSMKFCFIRNKLKSYLQSSKIEYLHIPELGIKSELRQNFKEDYNNLFEMYKKTTLIEQEEKIQKIIELSKENRIILMCFEKNKDKCHRGIVSKYIEEKGIGVNHI